MLHLSWKRPRNWASLPLKDPTKKKGKKKKEKGQDGEYVCRSSPSHLLFQMAFLEMQAQPQLSGIINFLACENVKSIVQKL